MKTGFRKAQAAMEFLMTYGWAILVVLVAIGALSYFGVLNPDNLLPNKCTLTSGFSCDDFAFDISSNTIQVVIRNGAGFTMDGPLLTIDECTGVANDDGNILNGQQENFTVTGCTLNAGDRFDSNINITYVNSRSGLNHTVVGSMTARVS